MGDVQQQYKPEAFIFDMDGTLFETDTLLRGVHERIFETLRQEGLYMGPTPPVDKLLGCLGMLLSDIWNNVMPNSSEAARNRADELMLQYELEGLEANEGTLYPHVEDVLQELKARGYKLFVASNGLETYVKGVAKHRGIAALFDGLYSAGEYQTLSKVDLVARLLKDHKIKSAWMVGDRSSDVEAGKSNGLMVAGCAYAVYGKAEELKGSDVLLTDFRELLKLIP
ncbi:phosphoglycolate phosphatase-like HAD superfamily hydrolase [Paenibacillus phyllosphaerae]|uniref:Phosphoglycolate phosphatase-like HAD superfamily hydrolase n=1 Tax=Paenibacillus phyllosphaerae TaxID=274593 RepID=A0A7W5FKP4_9BACL|nr:HAD hydrolase-like protein [Paenibacillus phyllosphaerae]MBB3108283.1 phosphoglycolate phosphatase-like HAD superfamily hydrolase [Paenibacillus phyllosphaerae]